MLIFHGGFWKGLIVAFFFGGCYLVFVFELINKLPRLILTNTGIYIRLLKGNPILWEDIESVELIRMAGNDYLSFKVKNHDTYVGILGIIQKK